MKAVPAGATVTRAIRDRWQNNRQLLLASAGSRADGRVSILEDFRRTSTQLVAQVMLYPGEEELVAVYDAPVAARPFRALPG